LELTPADEALMAAPPTPEEIDELACHLRDIRRQKEEQRRYRQRYPPRRAIVGFVRQRPKGLQRVFPEDPVPLEDSDDESPSFYLAELGIDPTKIRRVLS